MLKKFIFGGVIVLFLVSLFPISASAITTTLQPGTLIKGSGSSVYYYGADGKRYVFPTENTYKTWFITFNNVITISNEQLSGIPIGGNVTYKPGVKLVKITTDPKVYYVDKEGTLRWITSESLAINLWGLTWYKMIDDVPDPFFVNYKIGAPLETPALTTIPADYSINQDKLLSAQPNPLSSQTGTITLSGKADNQDAVLTWTTANLSAEQGFEVVMSGQSTPVYPGNNSHYLADPNIRTDSWTNLAAGTYHFRVCQYLGDSCGIYSNDVTVNISNIFNLNFDKKIGVIFTYDNQLLSASKIDSICDSQTDDQSLYAIKKWYAKEAAKYNLGFNLLFNCNKQQILIPEDMRSYYFCGPEGCITMPIDYTKVSAYIRTTYPDLQNNFANIVIHYSSTPKQAYNIAATDIYIFTQPVETEPFGLYGYSARAIAHEIAHKLGASDKYGDINRACQINPATGLEYSGYDIMCHRIREEGGYSQPELSELLVTEPTAKEMGWIN